MHTTLPRHCGSLLVWLCLSTSVTACQWFHHTPQIGHRQIAAATRALLDQSFAGIDYAAYHEQLERLETLAAEQLSHTPPQLRDQVRQLLDALRAADEILRWKCQRPAAGPVGEDPALARLVRSYPFLKVAGLGNVDSIQEFDPDAATLLLWVYANDTLIGIQVKSKPL